MQNNKIEQLKSMKLLQLWGHLPNPDHAFLTKNGRSHYAVLKNATYLPEVQAAILARESAVMGDPWEVVGSHLDDNKSVDFIIENLKRIGMNTLFRNIFHGIWYGYTILEHPMEKVNGKWFYAKINSLPSDWFSFNGHSQLIPSNHTNMTPLNITVGDLEKEVELVQYRPTLTNPYGESLLARVFWSATWIRGDMELWISYLDRFGDDSIIGKMDVGDERRKLQMLEAISQFKSSGAIVLEGTDELEVMKTDKANSSALFNNLYNVCVQQINKLILGHASALDGQPGKLGNDQSLSIVRQDITQDDKMFIEEVVNRLIQHLCLVNGIKETVTFAFTPEKEDENARVGRDQKIVAMGFELSEEYMRKAYRFGDDDLRKQRATSDTGFLSSEQQRNWKHHPKAPASPIPNFSEDIGKKSVSTDYYNTIDILIDQCKKNTSYSKLINKILKGISQNDFFENGLEAILQVGNNFEIDNDDFTLKLLNAYIIGRSQIAESMQTATFSENRDPIFSTFDEAREYFEARFDLPATHFHQLSNEMKKYAFTVGSIVREDVLADVSGKLLEAYDKGESFHKFKSKLDATKKEIMEISDRKLELIYTQNMNSAYSYGRYQGLMQAVDIFPNWEYITIGDERVRASHKALNGTIRRFDDPFWRNHYPPNGYRCRCVAEVSTEDPNGEGIPKWDKETVDKAFEDGIYPNSLQLGKEIKVSHGFDHNVGEMNGWIKDRIQQMNTTLDKIPTRISFFHNTSPLRDWDKNKKAITAGQDYSRLKNGLELARDRLKKDMGELGVVFDKQGNIVGNNFDYILEHISTVEKKGKRIFDQSKWESRAVLVDRIKDIISTGDIVEDVERYGKNKKLIIARKYVKNVKLNGENTPVMIIAEYPKNEKDSIPILTTIYPVRSNLEMSSRTGIIIKY